jgi:hypothetical protein
MVPDNQHPYKLFERKYLIAVVAVSGQAICGYGRAVRSSTTEVKVVAGFTAQLGSISSTCLQAAYTSENALEINFYITNNTMINFTSTLN